MKQIFSFHYTVCLLLLLLSASTASGQDFVWGRSGGGDAPTQGVDDETIKDMATDRNGNVYILSQVMTRGLQVAGIPLTGYGANDIMLASFKPDGSLRWTKVIGSTRPDNAFWLGTDNKDGVYFSASVLKDNSPAYIDKDATSPQNYQHNLLVKYDTAGRYQWHRHPEPESVPNANNWSNTATIAMDVGASGTVYWLMLLAPGTYGNGALTVATSGTYLLKYSASGTFSY